jgi:hypothetical protein
LIVDFTVFLLCYAFANVLVVHLYWDGPRAFYLHNYLVDLLESQTIPEWAFCIMVIPIDELESKWMQLLAALLLLSLWRFYRPHPIRTRCRVCEAELCDLDEPRCPNCGEAI